MSQTFNDRCFDSAEKRDVGALRTLLADGVKYFDNEALATACRAYLYATGYTDDPEFGFLLTEKRRNT